MNLPGLIEWANIRWFVRSKSWTELERTVMHKAARVHSMKWGENRRRSWILVLLDSLPSTMVHDELRARFPRAEGQQKLSLAYGLARLGQVEVEALVAGIIDKNTQGVEVSNIVSALLKGTDGKAQALPKIRTAAQSATTQKDWKTKSRLAIVAMYLGEPSIAEEMLRAEPVESAPQELPNQIEKLRQELAAFEMLEPKKQENPQVRLFRARACYYLDRYQADLCS